jgi:hypothetical protein
MAIPRSKILLFIAHYPPEEILSWRAIELAAAGSRRISRQGSKCTTATVQFLLS